MLRGNDRGHGEAQPQQKLLRPAAKQQHQKKRAADGHFDAFPVGENPGILLARVAAQKETLPVAPDVIQLGRCGDVAGRLQKSIDGIEILGDGDIG